MTDNETDTEDEPSYQIEDEEGPIQNDLKEEPIITEEPRTMATQETNSFEDIPNISQPPTPMTFEPQPLMNPLLSLNRRRETPKEKNFNKPTPFHGDRKKIETFIQECRMYLHTNREIYTEDEDKIIFMLSYMTDKDGNKPS